MARFNFLMMQAGIELSTPAVVVVPAVCCLQRTQWCERANQDPGPVCDVGDNNVHQWSSRVGRHALSRSHLARTDLRPRHADLYVYSPSQWVTSDWPHLTPHIEVRHLAWALLPHSPPASQRSLLGQGHLQVETCKWRKKTDNFKHFQAVTFQSPQLNLTFGHFKNNIHKVFDFLEWSFLMVKHKIIIRI